ncbi:MAG: bacterioferritin, partial [Nitrospira sp.]|nr:bacterioferritin [Nitrospira sp.]
MKAKEGVVDYLNQVLRMELTAVHQYMLHAALCKHWGYEGLYEHFEHLIHEEVEHSSGLMDHILYLEGTPEVDHVDVVTAGRTVQELLVSDLNFERLDAELLRKAIVHCTDVGDFTTRHKLEEMIVDTEEHIDWFET